MNRFASALALLAATAALPACGLVETPSDPDPQVTYYVSALHRQPQGGGAVRRTVVAIEYAVGADVRRDTLRFALAASDTVGTTSWSRVFEADAVGTPGLRVTKVSSTAPGSVVAASLLRNGETVEFNSSATVAAVGPAFQPRLLN